MKTERNVLIAVLVTLCILQIHTLDISKLSSGNHYRDSVFVLNYTRIEIEQIKTKVEDEESFRNEKSFSSMANLVALLDAAKSEAKQMRKNVGEVGIKFKNLSHEAKDLKGQCQILVDLIKTKCTHY